MVLSIISNDNDFNFIRDILLNKVTIPEYAIASRIAKLLDIKSVAQVDDSLLKAYDYENATNFIRILLSTIHMKDVLKIIR